VRLVGFIRRHGGGLELFPKKHRKDGIGAAGKRACDRVSLKIGQGCPERRNGIEVQHFFLFLGGYYCGKLDRL
jgi:hypothetical protein